MEIMIILILTIVSFILQSKLSKQKKINTSIIIEGNSKITSKNEIIETQRKEIVELAKFKSIVYIKNAEIETQQREIAVLAKYRPIVDVGNEILKIREKSNVYFAKMKQEASEYVKTERLKGKRLKELAENKIVEAHRLSDTIINNAKIDAEQIAGSAYEAKNNAKQYTETAKAMANIIEGYGDEYLIPGESLLDELAKDYNHTEAGRDLANIRLLIKSMIKNGMIADCNYSETNRRIAAIDFIIDAFNGKVDTIMSKAKHDNYGELLQKLKDAYRIVNHHGKAFKDARILPRYYDVIKDQLKLTVTVSELKKRDREEQKIIREEMREEERARREYEKRLKESQKEERILAKALKEVEARFKEATDSERAEYQLKLQKLQTELNEAIFKGKRALSMAQQTRMGHVYIISNIGSFGENVFKIGLTRRLEPMDRVKELGDASVPFPFDVHAMIHSEDAPALERELHQYFKEFQVNKINPRKEFFNLMLSDIKSKVEKMNLDINWTMKAKALEYRESAQIKLRENAVTC